MENYQLRCNQCGYIKTVLGNGFEDRTCELCGGEMLPMEQIETDRTDILLDRLVTEQIESDIQANGHSSCWYTIESINKAVVRVKYRKHFLLAGGQIPEQELLYIGENDKLFIKGE